MLAIEGRDEYDNGVGIIRKSRRIINDNFNTVVKAAIWKRNSTNNFLSIRNGGRLVWRAWSFI